MTGINLPREAAKPTSSVGVIRQSTSMICRLLACHAPEDRYWSGAGDSGDDGGWREDLLASSTDGAVYVIDAQTDQVKRIADVGSIRGRQHPAAGSPTTAISRKTVCPRTCARHDGTVRSWVSY